MEFFLPAGEEQGLYLVKLSPNEMRNKNIELTEKIVEEGYDVIVVTTNQPYNILRKNYEKNGIHLDNIFFVDTVTKNALGRDPQPSMNCRFINSPSNLTDTGIAIAQLLQVLEGKKVCVLFDSVSSMLIYLSSQNIIKFIHFITNKLRLMNFSGIFLIVENGLDPDALAQLTTFVDKVVDVEKKTSL